MARPPRAIFYESRASVSETITGTQNKQNTGFIPLFMWHNHCHRPIESFLWTVVSNHNYNVRSRSLMKSIPCSENLLNSGEELKLTEQICLPAVNPDVINRKKSFPGCSLWRKNHWIKDGILQFTEWKAKGNFGLTYLKKKLESVRIMPLFLRVKTHFPIK